MVRTAGERRAEDRATLRLSVLLAFLLVAPLPARGQGLTPEESPHRIANYEIEARLDPETRTVQGRERLTWSNTAGRPLRELCLHLYLNAFKNNRSTFARENAYRIPWPEKEPVLDSHWGYLKIENIQVVDAGDSPRTRIESLQYGHPDDPEGSDSTLLRVVLDPPLSAGSRVELNIEFTSKLPRGVARTGWVEDYFLVAQWFPKMGVFQEEQWVCHPYHRMTEYFADFGTYDVRLTVPADFVVGATGRRIAGRPNGDGTLTYHYYQSDVHDFAWTAGRRFREKKDRFSHADWPEVELTLLVLPEHEHLTQRLLAAARAALRYYGEWFGPYPYGTLTLVDAAYRSQTGGMEYPTLVTIRTRFWTPPATLSLEAVTIHEVGHQWWYGMVASNEFEESWLDEGINSWAEARVQMQVHPRPRFAKRLFGGIPLVFPSVEIPFETAALPSVRRHGTADVMVRPGWMYLNRDSYRTNSYRKPEMVLWTLGRLLGEERMLQVMRTYFERHRFRHPRTRDFIRAVHDVTGEDWNWFFEQTLWSSELVDYAVVSATSEPLPPPQGIFSGETVVRVAPSTGPQPYRSEVVVRRLQGALFPQEILMVFENGRQVRERWDGRERWVRYQYEGSHRLRYAVVDPERKILLDIDPTNNSRFVSDRTSRFGLATLKWASKWLFWLQNLLETFALLG